MTAAEDSGIKKGYEMGYDTARFELQPTIDKQKLELMNKDQEIARLKELLNSAQTDSRS